MTEPPANKSWGAGAAALCGKLALLLGWSPAQFWAATPDEVAAVLTAASQPAGNAGIDRRALDALMEQDRDG